MGTRYIFRFFAAAVVATWALLSAPVPSASAVSCPYSQVVFARGTGEPPGVGGIGQAFVDKLRSRVNRGSVGAYAVNYPASNDFSTALAGINDAGAHVQHMAATCPNTRMVLGGYSQGAAVIGFVTANAVPPGAPAGAPQPMPPEIANHVAAVVLFGAPNARAMNFLGEPPIVIGPLYGDKTIQLCVPNDPVCSDGLDWAAHETGNYDAVIDQGAAFAASRL